MRETELEVCPKMRCNNFVAFPREGRLPCAKHGLIMVPWSEIPLRKKIYREITQKIFKIRYATHRRSK